MGRRKVGLVFGVWAFLLLVAVFGVVLNVPLVRGNETPKTWTVDDDGPADFSKIQDAIDVATQGDTIFVYNGTYYENVVVDKNNLTLIGESQSITIIDGSGSGNVVTITANNLTISNFTIQHSGSFHEYSGIKLNSASNCKIANNTITNNGNHGIYLDSSFYNIISGNNIRHHHSGSGAPYGVGIMFALSSQNTVSGNNIADNTYGAFLWESSSNTLSWNDITNNFCGAKMVMSLTYNNSLSENNITNNHRGVDLEFADSNTISRNNITNNGYYGTGYGVELESGYNTVLQNNISDNANGARLVGSYNVVLGNIIVNNEENGLVASGANNLVRNNTIAGNHYNLYLGDIQEDVDTSNTVNGKPVYYLIGYENLTINPITYPAIGYLALINSYNITVEGLELTNNGQGLLIVNTTYSQIKNNHITSNSFGLSLSESSNNSISENNITFNGNGIWLKYSSSNSLIGNNVTANGVGISLRSYSELSKYSSNNSISGNNITNNFYGIYLLESSNNKIFHNNFSNNTNQVYDFSWVNVWTTPSINAWDDGYPSGGNYWSDYAGVDLYSGPNQNETGSDGIGDTPYNIDGNNQDNYPLMKPYGGSHDIGITDVTTSKTVVGQGYNLNITVTTLNYGIQTEDRNITVYANTTAITSQNVTLTSRNSTTITFTWNITDVPHSNYTITATATPVPNETDTTDNTKTDGWVVVTIWGDVNGDGVVNTSDYVRVKFAYSEVIIDPNADVDGNGVINILDVKKEKLILDGIL